MPEIRAVSSAQVVRKLIYVVADIHGRGDRFHEILDTIGFSEKDRLFILGDVIDRNPDGIRLLEEIMAADNMQMILGNHEYMMINASEDPAFPLNDRFTNLDLWYLNGGAITEAAFKALPAEKQAEILAFLKQLPLNLELTCGKKRYLLVHGSPVSQYKSEFCDYIDETEYAVWNRWDPGFDRYDRKTTVILGHTPTIHFFPRIPMEVYRKRNLLYIDCGCAYSAEEGGRLACLCLDTGGVLYSTV